MDVKRRSVERLTAVGLLANIFDGRSGLLGVVEDVSRRGVRVSTIPAAFADGVETCYAVVSSDREDYYLALHPRWVAPNPSGAFKTIGFALPDPPAAWEHCIKRLEKAQGADVELAA